MEVGIVLAPDQLPWYVAGTNLLAHLYLHILEPESNGAVCLKCKLRIATQCSVLLQFGQCVAAYCFDRIGGALPLPKFLAILIYVYNLSTF